MEPVPTTNDNRSTSSGIVQRQKATLSEARREPVPTTNRFHILASPSVENVDRESGTPHQQSSGNSVLYTTLDEWKQSTPLSHSHIGRQMYSDVIRSRVFTNPACHDQDSRTRSGVSERLRAVTQSSMGRYIGQGPVTDIRPSQRSTAPRKHTNRTCIGVFITRMAASTSTQQIRQHILMETGIVTRPEKLQTKYGGYSSFLIQCQHHIRSHIINPEIWPRGSLVKPFYS